MVARALATLLVAAALAGCVRHPGVPGRVLRPEGETIAVAPAKGVSLAGEFLGLRGDRLVVLSGGRLVEVTLPAHAEVSVEGYPAVKVGDRKRLPLYARYPQGLGEEQWGELLRQHGQAAFDSAPAP